MMLKSIAIIFFVLTSTFSPAPLLDPPALIMAPASLEVDPSLAYDVEAYLSGAMPSIDTNIYAISGVALADGGTYISLVGLDPDMPAPYAWNYEGDDVIWSGSLFLTGGIFSVYEIAGTETAGGGADVAFPWALGSKMLFGPRGIHGVQNNSVDWVSGDDFGEGAAGPEVYASAAGTIINVCEDDIQMGINVDGPDYRFGYLHLEKDSNLKNGTTFARGDYIGRLKYGTFSDTCGYATQSPNHYHLHWTFQPNDGIFKAESWILYYNTSEWKKGNQTVKINQWMTGGGGIDDPDDPTDPGDGTQPVTVPRFWTYVLKGVRAVFNVIANVLPNSALSLEGDELFELSANAAAEIMAIANIFLVNDIINMLPVVLLAAVVIIWRTFMFPVAIVLLVFKVLKHIPTL